MNEVEELEQLLVADDESESPLLCEVQRESHSDCTTIARWVCYGHPTAQILWCDARYAQWVKDCANGRLCRMCRQSTSHWKVVPL